MSRNTRAQFNLRFPPPGSGKYRQSGPVSREAEAESKRRRKEKQTLVERQNFAHNLEAALGTGV